jgi:hypothetical protein
MASEDGKEKRRELTHLDRGTAKRLSESTQAAPVWARQARLSVENSRFSIQPYQPTLNRHH